MFPVESLEPRRLFDGGQPIPSFGTNGTTTVHYAAQLTSGDTAGGSDFTQDRNGYTLIAARNFASDTDAKAILVTRLTPDGSIDTNFGDGGTLTLPRREDDIHSPEIQTNLAGQVYVRDKTVISRLTTRGKLDASFGDRGKIKVPLIDNPTGFVIDDQNRIYVYGSDSVNDDGSQLNSRMAVIRLTAAGKLDTNWANNGEFIPPAPEANLNADNRSEVMNQIKLLDNGQVMVAGEGSFQLHGISLMDSYVISSRLNADGTADKTYGDGGSSVVIKDGTSKKRFALTTVFFEDNGRLVGKQISAFVNPRDGVSSAINFEISGDGTAIGSSLVVDDAALNTLGIDTFSRAIEQPDGKFIVGGNSGELFRVNSDGSLDTTWASSGVLTPSGGATAFKIADDGALAVLNSTSPASVNVIHYFRDDRPTALATAKGLATPRSGSILINVTWQDDDGVDPSTLDSNDLFVTLPDGTRRSVRFDHETALGNGSFAATYRLTSAGGWDASDNGAYTIFARGGAVTDVNGVRDSTDEIGSFNVDVG